MGMKVSTRVAALFTAGLVLTGFFFYRYFVQYPDLDRAIVYPFVGLNLMFWAWTIHQLINKTEKNEKQDIVINAIEDKVDIVKEDLDELKSSKGADDERDIGTNGSGSGRIDDNNQS